jgi:hypothetical protein
MSRFASLVLLFPLVASADPDANADRHARKARELLELTGADAVAHQTLEAMLEQFRLMPGLPPGFVDAFREGGGRSRLHLDGRAHLRRGAVRERHRRRDRVLEVAGRSPNGGGHTHHHGAVDGGGPAVGTTARGARARAGGRRTHALNWTCSVVRTGPDDGSRTGITEGQEVPRAAASSGQVRFHRGRLGGAAPVAGRPPGHDGARRRPGAAAVARGRARRGGVVPRRAEGREDRVDRSIGRCDGPRGRRRDPVVVYGPRARVPGDHVLPERVRARRDRRSGRSNDQSCGAPGADGAVPAGRRPPPHHGARSLVRRGGTGDRGAARRAKQGGRQGGARTDEVGARPPTDHRRPVGSGGRGRRCCDRSDARRRAPRPAP